MKKYRRFFLWCIVLIVGGAAGLFWKVKSAGTFFAAGGENLPKTTADGIAPLDDSQDSSDEGSTHSTPQPSNVTEEFCVVFVCGAVGKEGVYSVPSSGRIADAIEAAGGFSSEADTTYLNLAGHVSDGIRIYVPTKEEAAALPSPSAGLFQTGESGLSAKVNINKASVEDLMRLPGIGETKAKKILEYRKKVGLFLLPEDITKVSGIGDAIFQNIKDRITTEE